MLDDNTIVQAFVATGGAKKPLAPSMLAMQTKAAGRKAVDVGQGLIDRAR